MQTFHQRYPGWVPSGITRRGPVVMAAASPLYHITPPHINPYTISLLNPNSTSVLLIYSPSLLLTCSLSHLLLVTPPSPVMLLSPDGSLHQWIVSLTFPSPSRAHSITAIEGESTLLRLIVVTSHRLLQPCGMVTIRLSKPA